MITEDYVSFETAKLLKEKGFVKDVDNRFSPHFAYNKDGQFSGPSWDTEYNAPTLQMAMKWLREVHKLHISVEMGFDVDNYQYYFFVPSVCRFSNKDGEYLTPFGENEFNTYKIACESAIKYCLENLI